MTNLEKPDHANERPKTPEELRQDIMETYYKGTAVLGEALQRSRDSKDMSLAESGEVVKSNPRGVVIVSLWEENDTLLTAKMFQHSLDELLNQAQVSGLDLDIFIIGNNGGGATPEIGNKMISHVNRSVEANPQIGKIHRVKTHKPDLEGIDATTPWDVPLSQELLNEKNTGNRAFIIEQSPDILNKGKIRAIRDIASCLSRQIAENGYTPDFVFQMDAETILEYTDPKLAKAVAPLKAMYNQLSRGQLVAVGTKDRFAVMDPETGKPLDTPVGSTQKGYEATNTPDRFVSLPGGALMARPENYLAAMVAITRETPSMGVEDYLFTKILRDEARSNETPFESVAKSMGGINHLNRTPGDWKQAINQMANWRKHARAADEIFPENPYNTEGLYTYVSLVVQSRFKDAMAKGPRHLFRLIRDVQDIPAVLEFLNDETVADVTNRSEGVQWTTDKVVAESITSLVD